ncbi:hypothetical protein C7U60_17395 [Mesorhizobium plurifarium]|nr:hypothetical protein C7U60_17395 [Mesorhizobium plurifarium]
MPVLVAPARPVTRISPLLATAIARWRLGFVLHMQWAVVSRRGDPHLLADAVIPDTYRLGHEEAGRQREAARHRHWML